MLTFEVDFCVELSNAYCKKYAICMIRVVHSAAKMLQDLSSISVAVVFLLQ